MYQQVQQFSRGNDFGSPLKRGENRRYCRKRQERRAERGEERREKEMEEEGTMPDEYAAHF
jgi:hypothetical protein